MRDYAVVPTKFWITPLAKSLRGNPAAQVVALYLLSGPHANMIGLYHLPVAYIAQDTGIPIEGASKALSSLSEAGYCTFDEQADVVFVHGMAPEQIGPGLALADKRTKAVLREWMAVQSDSLRREFHRRYAEAYHLPPMPGGDQLDQEATKPLAAPIEAPSMPLGSQDQEHGQEHDHRQESFSSGQSPDGAISIGKVSKPAQNSIYSPEFEQAWKEYPMRPGHSKTEAYKCWKARLASGEDVQAMVAGVRRYAAYCEAMRTESRFVKHAATFFGPDRHYLSDYNWTPAAAAPMRGAWAAKAPIDAEARDAQAMQLLGFGGGGDHAAS
ncbi:hypothetical protein ACSFBI_01430 [Variovorax sp. RB3P1]|uniref:hypothetical protein n=1 Tax=Variovorax sp. RB3P1 TaxID=3443732 RepID=UPI003F46CDC0